MTQSQVVFSGYVKSLKKIQLQFLKNP